MDLVSSVFTLRFEVLRCGSHAYLLHKWSFPSRKEAVRSVLQVPTTQLFSLSRIPRVRTPRLSSLTPSRALLAFALLLLL